MEILGISRPRTALKGKIYLEGSKSISNRVLIIRALADSNFTIQHIAQARDTQVLKENLGSRQNVWDVGHAGTSFRFLTAYLSIQNGTQILTGSDRMKSRPIAPLVEALNSLGADIKYKGEIGFPPLEIGEFDSTAGKNEIRISAGISSQFISALLLIAPVLQNGLKLELATEPVSSPYIEMTLNILKEFGIESDWKGHMIHIPRQSFKVKDYKVESDWSAASYYYGMASLSNNCELELENLYQDSVQGDREILNIAGKFGVHSSFDGTSLLLRSTGDEKLKHLDHNFVQHPDLAQTVSLICACHGTEAVFTGLQTLRIKETDRIRALQEELKKLGVYLSQLPSKFSRKSGLDYYLQQGKARTEVIPRFRSYDDHRMAMSLSILSMLFPIEIEEPDVVQKSYPGFWDDLASLGFVLERKNIPTGD